MTSTSAVSSRSSSAQAMSTRSKSRWNAIWATVTTEIDIVIPSPVWRAGEPITGHLACRPQQDLPTADIAVYWQREREHHPLERYPGQGGSLDGPPLYLGKKIPMHGGTEFGLPFALPLPADAAPTATAVHSSLSWFLGARIFYSGFTSHQHRARPPADRRRQRAVVRPAKSPMRRPPARPSAARPCSAGTARRPAARSPRLR